MLLAISSASTLGAHGVTPALIKNQQAENILKTAPAFSGYRPSANIKKPPTASRLRVCILNLAMSYSHMGNPTLPSALFGFTSEFEMGSGGSQMLLSPESLSKKALNVIQDLFITGQELAVTCSLYLVACS